MRMTTFQELPIIGSLLAEICEGLGIKEEDFPDIIPDNPTDEDIDKIIENITNRHPHLKRIMEDENGQA